MGGLEEDALLETAVLFDDDDVNGGGRRLESPCRRPEAKAGLEAEGRRELGSAGLCIAVGVTAVGGGVWGCDVEGESGECSDGAPDEGAIRCCRGELATFDLRETEFHRTYI